MDTAWETVENSANILDNLPKWEYNESADGHNVVDLAARVVGLKHLQVQYA